MPQPAPYKPSVNQVLQHIEDLVTELSQGYKPTVPGERKAKAGEERRTRRKPKRTPDGGFLYGDETTVEAPGKSITARYALVELSTLITSHNPATFRPNPDYPAGCQQRDYERDKAEQGKVETNAARFNPRYLVTDSPTATDGPPVVTPERVVLGGNSRTMSLMLVSERGEFDGYRDYLRKAASVYGFDSEDIAELSEPVLVRVVDVDMNQCAAYSNMLNKALTQGIDVTTETVSYARQLSAEDLEYLAGVLSDAGEETWAKTIERRSIANRIVEQFRKSGIITDRNVSEWVTNAGALTDKGRLLVEKVLIGAILPDKSLIEAARVYTNQLLRSLPLMIRLNKMPPEWNLIPDIQGVVKLESERRASGTDKGQFVNQVSFDRPELSERQRMVWELMDAGPRKFHEALGRYVDQGMRAVEQDYHGGGFDFGETPMTPDEALWAALKSVGLSDRYAPVELPVPALSGLKSPSKRPRVAASDGDEWLLWAGLIGLGIFIAARRIS